MLFSLAAPVCICSKHKTSCSCFMTWSIKLIIQGFVVLCQILLHWGKWQALFSSTPMKVNLWAINWTKDSASFYSWYSRLVPSARKERQMLTKCQIVPIVWGGNKVSCINSPVQPWEKPLSQGLAGLWPLVAPGHPPSHPVLHSIRRIFLQDPCCYILPPVATHRWFPTGFQARI